MVSSVSGIPRNIKAIVETKIVNIVCKESAYIIMKVITAVLERICGVK